MDIGKVFCGSRSEGWVDANGNLAIDATLTDGDYSMMEVAKQLHVNGYTGEQTSGDGGWYAGISDSDDDKIFGYFQATWGINTNLLNNCESSSGGSTAGDWAIIEGPAPYFEAAPITPSSRGRICSRRRRTSWNFSRRTRGISPTGRRNTATS